MRDDRFDGCISIEDREKREFKEKVYSLEQRIERLEAIVLRGLRGEL